MFAHFIVLLATLSFLVNNTDAASLRSLLAEPAEAEIPIDHETASRIVRSTVKFLSTLAENSRQKSAEPATQKHADARKYAESAMTVLQANSADPIVYSGSVVMRYRPNGDCSGIPSIVIAERIGGCSGYDSSDGATSTIYTACKNDGGSEGHMEAIRAKYSNYDCGSTSSEEHLTMRRCAMRQSYNSQEVSLPAMVTHQCSSKHYNYFAMQSGGLAFYKYEGSRECQNEASLVSVQRFHACELSVQYYNYDGTESDTPTYSDKNTYHYASFDGCTPNGDVKVTYYSDPACTRPLGRGVNPIGPNQCWDMTEGSSEHITSGKLVCIPEPGQH